MKRCRHCKKPFEPRFSTLEACCSPPCAIAYAKAAAPERIEQMKARAAAKEQTERRVAKRKWREDTATIPQLKAKADKEFGRFIRERDYYDTCICCAGVPDAHTIAMLAVKGHLWDAGHWRSKGAADHLRYNEDNCHKQMVSCNRDKSGNSVAYRVRLIVKIGIARVEALENDNATFKWTREGLIAIRRLYLGKWKEIVATRETRAA